MKPHILMVRIAASLVQALVLMIVLYLQPAAQAADPQAEYQQKLRAWELDKLARDEKLKKKLVEAEATKQAQLGNPVVATTGVAEPRGVAITAIGAVVNATSRDHMERVLNEIALVARKGVAIGPIFLVGRLSSFSPSDLIGIMQKLSGGQARFVRQAPSDVKITRSPTWFVYTPQGRIVLEGVNLASRVTKQKEFIDKGSVGR